jgi:hypothetical protein
MTDMMPTIIPKSDQLNADDLLGRPITIKITKVAANPTSAEQPIAVSFEGDGGKPYMPCKSMRRVMVNVWGPNGNEYVGRSLTLFRDDKVMFGGLAVGGIRISHMSDITAPVTMALTATRANRKPFTVQPMPKEAPPKARGLTVSELTARFKHNTTRAGHLAIVDDPDVIKALDWLQKNRPAAHEALDAEIRESWKRTEPTQKATEPAADDIPFENDPNNAVTGDDSGWPGDHPDGGPRIAGEHLVGAG